MTNEEINKIIAKFCGWVEYHPTPESISKGYPHYSYWIPPRDSKQSFENWGKLEMDYPPDYCNNLNAMAEAENVLTTAQTTTMSQYLHRRLGMLWGFATASQRAEAFVRTIGKWD